MSSGVLVVAELVQQRPTGLSLELLALARALVARLGGVVGAVCPGACGEAAAELVAHGADRVYTAGGPELAAYDSDAWTDCAMRALSAARAAAVLAGHTTSGADLAPRLAFRAGAGIATGCVAVEAGERGLLCTRPCYGGNVRETLLLEGPLAVATVRRGSCRAAPRDAARAGETVAIAPDPSARRARIVERRRESAGFRLEDARVVVAGGRGLDGPGGFELLGELARELDAAVGASRVPCDLGWCPHSLQIGLTGRTVAPELYIAVGISGAGHHLAGCGGAKNIVAINTDPDAAIYREARWGVVGDYREVIPPLIEALRALRSADGLERREP